MINFMMSYIDPGSGSFLLQMALAGLFGAAYVLKAYTQKVKIAFQTILRKK